MRGKCALIFILTMLFIGPALAYAAKCTRVLPKEVFQFFKQDPDDVDCEDYEYKLIDFNDDSQMEVVVTNYRRSCEDAGYCNFEIFEKKDEGWKHIATVPGRFRVLATKTNGYHDLSTWLLGHSYVYIWDGHSYRDMNKPDNNELRSVTPTPGESPNM